MLVAFRDSGSGPVDAGRYQQGVLDAPMLSCVFEESGLTIAEMFAPMSLDEVARNFIANWIKIEPVSIITPLGIFLR
jgi:hypothetical protein